MMIKQTVIRLFVSIFFSFQLQAQYDLVIVGGNPGGIMAAISAAKLGKTSVILERTKYIGGLPANGLGATDIGTRGATTGLFADFVARNKQYYIQKYGANSTQVKKCSDGYHFEPVVAEQTFSAMIIEYGDKIKVLTMRQFDAFPDNVTIVNDRITSVKVLNRTSGKVEVFTGKVFLDATYEGDLGAAAQIPFRVGREGKAELNEPGAGVVYKYWDGPETIGTTFLADNAVQAYNYRLCLTDDPANRIPFYKPQNYNRQEYISLIDDVWLGRHTGVQMLKVTPEMQLQNKLRISKGDSITIPGDKWGIHKITNMVALPNRKTDANNQHSALISTDLAEENWPWPTSDWKWRDAYAERLKNYTLGLFWFAQNDKELPESFRKAVSRWGFAKDEYENNNGFPRQVYVREGRRFECLSFFTAHDALPTESGKRPCMYSSSVTASHYALDSHAVRKRDESKTCLDGFISYKSSVYTVPFGVMVPKQIDNLLLPVPVSGSHIGFSTLRMEPCWMALGQAAGVASSLAIDTNSKIKNVDIDRMQEILVEQKATLIFYKDIRPEDPNFEMVQFMGVRGYLPEWNAELSKTIDNECLLRWKTLSNIKLDTVQAGKSTKGDVLKEIYSKIKVKK
jgi:hypothetical protein